jgi:hypothetical protein
MNDVTGGLSREERWTVADEQFAEFMRAVCRHGLRRTRALREARPTPWDVTRAALQAYDAETEMQRRFIRGQGFRDVG